jgi:hypothetical protein
MHSGGARYTPGHFGAHQWWLAHHRAVRLGKRQGMKTRRECHYTRELDLETLVWTCGPNFPLSGLEDVIKKIDGWAKAQKIERSEAIRRLVELGLKAAPAGKGKRP